MSVDRLFDIKNNYYIGNYQGCISDAQKLSARGDEEKELRDVFMYRAYIAQKKMSVVLAEVPSSVKGALKAVRRLAEFENSQNKEAFAAQVEAEAQGVDNDMAAVLYATILISAGNPEEALRLLFPVVSLEARAASIHALLSMDRVDMAIKELKKMCEMDEDATITQLSVAWVNMSVGKDKLKDAFYIYQEMIDKYGATVYLLIGQSNSLIAQERFDEADKILQEVLSRDPNSVEAMVNRLLIADSKNKQNVKRQLVQMRSADPNHPFVQDYEHVLGQLNDLC